jgi:hypothetical protein
LSIALSCETLRGKDYDATVNVEDQVLSSSPFCKFRTSVEDNDDEPGTFRHGSKGEGLLIRKGRNKRKVTVTYT